MEPTTRAALLDAVLDALAGNLKDAMANFSAPGVLCKTDLVKELRARGWRGLSAWFLNGEFEDLLRAEFTVLREIKDNRGRTARGFFVTL